MSRKSIKQLLAEQRPLVLPTVHDALSARMAEHAGFPALSVGGSTLGAMRHAVPDIGLKSFGDVTVGLRDIMAASSLPVFLDGEDGYGDVKNITRTVETLEAMGIGGLALEDHGAPNLAGGGAPDIISLEQMGEHLEAALTARESDDTFIIGRTDSTMALGLDEAIRRGQRYEEIGVDAVFIAAALTVEQTRHVRDSLKGPLLACIVEVMPVPRLSPQEYYNEGYEMVIYPATLLFRIATAIRDGLAAIRDGEIDVPEGAMTHEEINDVLDIAGWGAVDAKFAGAKPA